MSKQKIGPDNWLYILTNAVSNYVNEGGTVEIIDDEEIASIVIVLNEVEPGDKRLHPDFEALIDAHMKCLDCGHNTNLMGEDYMVNDAVWETANPDGGGRLCIGCIEQRLDRRLQPEDFSQYIGAPINEPNETKSARLCSRLESRGVAWAGRE
jgi:hypothetical protein